MRLRVAVVPTRSPVPGLGRCLSPPPPARLSVTLADVFLAFACFEFYLRSKSPMHKKKLYNFTISEPFRNNSSLEKSAPRS